MGIFDLFKKKKVKNELTEDDVISDSYNLQRLELMNATLLKTGINKKDRLKKIEDFASELDMPKRVIDFFKEKKFGIKWEK